MADPKDDSDDKADQDDWMEGYREARRLDMQEGPIALVNPFNHPTMEWCGFEGAVDEMLDEGPWEDEW